MASYLVRADVATIAAIEAGFADGAARIGDRWPDDPDLATEDQRQVRAVLMAATGGTARHSLAIDQTMLPMFFYLKAAVAHFEHGDGDDLAALERAAATRGASRGRCRCVRPRRGVRSRG